MNVVFDLDGTLVDSGAQVLETTRALVAEATGRRPSLAEVAHREAGTFEATFANHGLSGEHLIPRWGELALRHACRAFRGIPSLLVALRAAGHRLHVWTARDAVSAAWLLERAGISHHFEGRVVAWSPRHPKPDARGLATLVSDAPPAEVVVIGDGWTDLQGARAYGAAHIAALWSPHADEPRLRREGATTAARTPREVRAHVRSR